MMLLFVLIVATFSFGSALEPRDGFYVMAHMCNTPSAADWALSVGANAVETDLNFVNNIPTKFVHGGICDCLCSWIGEDQSVCDYLDCDSTTDATVLLNHFAAQPNLALVMIDSKVDFTDVNQQHLAGFEVTDLLVNQLFEKGFLGEVVVSVATVDYFEYLYAVANSSNATPYASRFHFTFDGEEKDITTDFQYMLQLPTMNRVFGTGNTACLPGEFESTLQVAESNRKQGNSGMSYVWTLNLESSMRDYLAIPAGGIMTNYPQRAYENAIAQGFTLATPATRIPAATSNGYEGPCDCDFDFPGCKVSTPAPKFTACKCSLSVFSCNAEVVSCKDPSSPLCANPDTSKSSCQLGGGNCGGY
eukprot:Phypoly_transcript_10227.p1 GENE.Phypoly_transcript_10227~~Phypoly_transcript_10227.p1  ORF type:complete len:361 (+),score=61.04 Phypoly_transcript_10227:71-1153(+)